MNKIEIWSPKYSNNTVLIAKHKVAQGENLIYFTEANHLPNYYSMQGADIIKYPTQVNLTKNGKKLVVYVVPLNDFKVLVK